MSYFSYVDYVLKGVSTFIKNSVGDHSFTSSIMLSLWSTMKPREDCKTIISSVNYVSLLVVLRPSSEETVL